MGATGIEAVTERRLDEIIAALGARDRSALAELYDLYSPLVYRIALGITLSPDDAEDVVQDVFLDLEHRLRAFGQSGSFEGWLRKVTVRTTLSRLRTLRRRSRLRLIHAEPRPADAAAGAAARVDVERLLDGLPPKLRAVVTLREPEQLTHREVADALGISESAAKVRYHRAMYALRRRAREWSD